MSSRSKIKVNHTKYDLSEMNRPQLLELKLIVQEALAHMDNAIAKAKAGVHTDGIYSDAGWFLRINTAKKIQGINMQKINLAISKFKIETQKNRSFPDLFVDAARDYLDEDTFSIIFKDAQLRNAENKRSLSIGG